MADLACQYTLTTPGGTIQFNDYQADRFNEYGPDEYYITDAQGLDMAPLRTPIDNRPQTHGGIVHPFFKGPRPVTLEGALMIRSTRVLDTVRRIRNDMEFDLQTALESILDSTVASGTLTWTIPFTVGSDARSLTVQCNVPVEYRGIELKTFTFGLIAANPDY